MISLQISEAVELPEGLGRRIAELSRNLSTEITELRGIVVDLSILAVLGALSIIVLLQLLKSAYLPRFNKSLYIRWSAGLATDKAGLEQLGTFLVSREATKSRSAPPERPPGGRQSDPPKNQAEQLPGPTIAQITNKRISEMLTIGEGGIFFVKHVLFSLPRRLFLRQIENDVRNVLDQPGANPQRFWTLTAGTSPRDRLRLLEWYMSDENNVEEKMPDQTAAAALRINAAVERHLDELQLTMELEWANRMRIIALVLGIGISFLAGAFLGLLDRPVLASAVFLSLGLIAGMLAMLIYDATRRVVYGV